MNQSDSENSIRNHLKKNLTTAAERNSDFDCVSLSSVSSDTSDPQISRCPGSGPGRRGGQRSQPADRQSAAHGDHTKSAAFSTEAAANAAIFPFFLCWDLSVKGRMRQLDPVCLLLLKFVDLKSNI